MALDDDPPPGRTPSGEPPRLGGQVVVLAGAGGEIGAALASRYAAVGAIVVGIDRQPFDAPFELIHADLTDEAAVVDALDQIVTAHGRIDVLHNNAGPIDLDDRSLEATPSAVWAGVFRAILRPVELACRHGAPILRRNGPDGGSILNTGSFLVDMGAATAQMAFSAAKAAVTQLSRDLAVHLARDHIRVNTLALGPVTTDFTEAMFASLGPEETARRLARIPMGRFATLGEVAGAAVFLASGDAGYITGSDFPVYGGIRPSYTIPERPSDR